MNMRRNANNLFGSRCAPRLSGFATSLLVDVALPSRHQQFDVTALVTQRGPILRWLLLFFRRIYEADRSPRHATRASTYPSNPVAPIVKMDAVRRTVHL